MRALITTTDQPAGFDTMKLLTCMTPQNPTTPRLAALMANGVTVADLQQGHVDRTGSASPLLNDMLSLLGGGEQALEQARVTLKCTASQAIREAAMRKMKSICRPHGARDIETFFDSGR
jgi:hypothetical protein